MANVLVDWETRVRKSLGDACTQSKVDYFMTLVCEIRMSICNSELWYEEAPYCFTGKVGDREVVCRALRHIKRSDDGIFYSDRTFRIYPLLIAYQNKFRGGV